MSAIQAIELDDIGEDNYRPRGRGRVVRAANRLLTPAYRGELAKEVLLRCERWRPDAVLIYKGKLVGSETVDAVRETGTRIVNIFPDCSPHAHGRKLRDVMGKYDLVISAKPFHPRHWNSTYGFSNRCVCVPHGYDPAVHYWPALPEVQDIDVVLAASWRPQYERLMADVGRLLPDKSVAFALAGPGWPQRRSEFPDHWQSPGPLFGRAYGDFVRRGKIVIAPVHTEVVVDGKRQPGDEDTTRTYELAAAGTFFLHRRTPFVGSVYEEGVESVFWSDAVEMVDEIKRFLPLEKERKAIAAAAHARAVPAYSVPARAQEVLAHVRRLVAGEYAGKENA
jgi:hypothetical protein